MMWWTKILFRNRITKMEKVIGMSAEDFPIQS